MNGQASNERRRAYIAALSHRDAMASLVDQVATAENVAALQTAEDRVAMARHHLEAHGEAVPPASASAFTPPAGSVACVAARVLAA